MSTISFQYVDHDAALQWRRELPVLRSTANDVDTQERTKAVKVAACALVVLLGIGELAWRASAETLSTKYRAVALGTALLYGAPLISNVIQYAAYDRGGRHVMSRTLNEATDVLQEDLIKGISQHASRQLANLAALVSVPSLVCIRAAAEGARPGPLLTLGVTALGLTAAARLLSPALKTLYYADVLRSPAGRQLVKEHIQAQREAFLQHGYQVPINASDLAAVLVARDPVCDPVHQAFMRGTPQMQRTAYRLLPNDSTLLTAAWEDLWRVQAEIEDDDGASMNVKWWFERLEYLHQISPPRFALDTGARDELEYLAEQIQENYLDEEFFGELDEDEVSEIVEMLTEAACYLPREDYLIWLERLLTLDSGNLAKLLELESAEDEEPGVAATVRDGFRELADYYVNAVAQLDELDHRARNELARRARVWDEEAIAPFISESAAEAMRQARNLRLQPVQILANVGDAGDDEEDFVSDVLCVKGMRQSHVGPWMLKYGLVSSVDEDNVWIQLSQLIAESKVSSQRLCEEWHIDNTELGAMELDECLERLGTSLRQSRGSHGIQWSKYAWIGLTVAAIAHPIIRRPWMGSLGFGLTMQMGTRLPSLGPGWDHAVGLLSLPTRFDLLNSEAKHFQLLDWDAKLVRIAQRLAQVFVRTLAQSLYVPVALLQGSHLATTYFAQAPDDED